jgi:hypothetical protein
VNGRLDGQMDRKKTFTDIAYSFTGALQRADRSNRFGVLGCCLHSGRIPSAEPTLAYPLS